jgi:hypothetical protein
VRQRLRITQPRDDAQHPSRKIEHAMDKAAPVSVEHAQKDHDHEQNIYRINGHVEIKITCMNCQFPIANLPMPHQSAIGNWKSAINEKSNSL